MAIETIDLTPASGSPTVNVVIGDNVIAVDNGFYTLTADAFADLARAIVDRIKILPAISGQGDFAVPPKALVCEIASIEVSKISEGFPVEVPELSAALNHEVFVTNNGEVWAKHGWPALFMWLAKETGSIIFTITITAKGAYINPSAATPVMQSITVPIVYELDDASGIAELAGFKTVDVLPYIQYTGNSSRSTGAQPFDRLS